MTYSKIKKISFLTVILCSFLAVSYAQNGIEFSHLTWTEILVKAKKENKPIFLDAYASWCGPCKQMSKQTFTDEKVGVFFNRKFISVKMDMEKGEGLILSEQFDIQAYPTLLFLDSDGNILHRVCGFRNATTLLKDGKMALNSEKRFAFYHNKFQNGERNPEFLKTFMQVVLQSCSNPEKVIEAYWKTQKTEDYTSEFNWRMYLDFVQKIHSEQFMYLIQNLDEFQQIYGDDPDAYIIGTYRKTLSEVANHYLKIYKNDENEAKQVLTEYEKCKNDILAQNYPKSPTVIYEFELGFFERLGWYEEYTKTAIEYVNYGVSNEHKADKLNQLAWIVYENTEDSKSLGHAIEWVKASIEIVEAYANTDTYSALLFKTGALEKGKQMAEKAIEIAKENNQDYSETENLMRQYLK